VCCMLGVSWSAQSSRSEPLAELAPAALSGWPAYSPAALTVLAYSLGELEFRVALNWLSYRGIQKAPAADGEQELFVRC
jgi:hypothetical protein